MDALIFFAVIIIFSIIEGIGKRKRGRARGPIQLPDDGEPDEEAWRVEERARPEELPTYDADPSYDDLEQTRVRPSGSEGLIPTEIWREIEKLAERAQGRRPRPSRTSRPEPEPVPSRSRGRDASSSAARRGASSRRGADGGQEHRVHLSHTEFGTDPSERAPSEQDGLDPLARALGADPAAARRQLRKDGRHALRQAVIMQEILGPPASLVRREDLTDPFSD